MKKKDKSKKNLNTNKDIKKKEMSYKDQSKRKRIRKNKFLMTIRNRIKK